MHDFGIKIGVGNNDFQAVCHKRFQRVTRLTGSTGCC